MFEPSRFFDLQVNGYAGVDFNAARLSVEEIAVACEALRRDGVAGILATIITDKLPLMCERIHRIAEACRQSPQIAQMIRGIHVEGPFISAEPGYVGTHPASAVQPATRGAAEPLVAAGEGLVRLVTLAPEQDVHYEVTGWLAEQGITVAAGHCNPSLDQLLAAIDAGLTMFTHLGNGCPLELGRHDNIIQRVLSLSDRLWVCFIADGVHVPFFALRNYLRNVGLDRAVVVSDAISAAGLGPGEFSLAGQTVVVDEQLATWAPDRSHLMGAAAPLKLAYENLVQHVGLSENDALRLTSTNPRAAIGASQ